MELTDITFLLALKVGAGLCVGWLTVSMIWGGLIMLFHKPIIAFLEWWTAD